MLSQTHNFLLVMLECLIGTEQFSLGHRGIKLSIDAQSLFRTQVLSSLSLITIYLVLGSTLLPHRYRTVSLTVHLPFSALLPTSVYGWLAASLINKPWQLVSHFIPHGCPSTERTLMQGVLTFSTKLPQILASISLLILCCNHEVSVIMTGCT